MSFVFVSCTMTTSFFVCFFLCSACSAQLWLSSSLFSALSRLRPMLFSESRCICAHLALFLLYCSTHFVEFHFARFVVLFWLIRFGFVFCSNYNSSSKSEFKQIPYKLDELSLYIWESKSTKRNTTLQNEKQRDKGSRREIEGQWERAPISTRLLLIINYACDYFRWAHTRGHQPIR